MSSAPTVAPKSLDASARRSARRASRHEARYVQWGLSSLKRVRACGRYAVDKSKGVRVMVSGSTLAGTRQAGVGGVQSCGSVWACPVCAEKIQAARQGEIASALAVARLRGLEVQFLTLTMRHDDSRQLETLWGYLNEAWRFTTTGSPGVPYTSTKGRAAGRKCKGSKGDEWKADRAEFGVVGYVRLVEITLGENGWHVHVHALLVTRPLSDFERKALGRRMFGRWQKALNRHRGMRPSLARGLDIRKVVSDEAAAEYFAKGIYDRKGEGSTAHDVTGSHGKDAKYGGRTPFGILAGLVALDTGELLDGLDADHDFERDQRLWREFERASKGRRQLLFSQGLRDLLLDGAPELTDQEIVDEAPGGEVVVTVSADEWTYLGRRRRHAALLDAAEADDTGNLLREFVREIRLRIRT